MKLQFKALSLTLGIVTLLGICSSVKGGTPEITDAENNVEMTPIDEMGAESSEEIGSDEPEASEEMETEFSASEEIEEAELEASKEIEDAENSEIESPELEATEEAESIDESSSIEGTTDETMESTKTADDNADYQF